MIMHDDDDQLAAFDLSAWDAPPPSPGLVDGVIERARQPASVAALESVEPIARPTRGTRRWWIAAAVAAVAFVAIGFGVWGIQRTPQDGHGEVHAQAAQTFAIGPTTAALDPGTTVRWRRDKRRITVAQPRGAALWNVAANDTLVIDAGAMGATVEASGGSLRVEVEMMNASETRAVGISAATAVAVALVTIVVYEGTVRVRQDGQTVNVVPGAQYAIRPPNVTEPFAVGAAPVDPRIRALEDRLAAVEAERDALRGQLPAKTPPTEIPDTLTRAAITATMQPLSAQILACPTNGFVGTAKVRVVVAPGGEVTTAEVSAQGKPVPAALASCIEGRVRSASFPATHDGGSFGYPYAYEAPACNADALRQKGDDHLGTGMDAAALAAYEKSMRCRPDAGLVAKTYMAACRSKNAAKAKQYFAQLPASRQQSLSMICIRVGIQVP